MNNNDALTGAVPAALAASFPPATRRYRSGATAVATAVALACAAAHAADGDGPAKTQGSDQSSDQIQEVVVTGSRISRRDYDSNSPILTIDDSLLKDSGTSAIEENLTKLPQFHAVQTPAQGGDIQPTATDTPGAATISLRGLGDNRDLILIDGRRATPGNASEVVDINTIPALAIERVETITGGASSTYGADAVSGVVNFIMRKKFEGVQFDAQAGESQRGDAFEYQVGGIMGSNLADGRGNVMLSFSVNDRQSALHTARPWFVAEDENPNTGLTNAGLASNDVMYFPNQPGYDPEGTAIPSQSVVNGIFNQVGAGAVSNATRFYFNPDGTAFTGFFQSTAAGSYRFEGGTTGPQYIKNTNGALSENFQDALAVLPLHRDAVLTRGNYEISDWLSFDAMGMFSKVQTETVQQPSPSVNGWSASIPVDGRSLPTDLATLLASRPDPNAPWQLVDNLANILGNRASTVDVLSYNLQAGFSGVIPKSDWTWEAYASTGESDTSALISGVASLDRLRAVIEAPNWGAGFSSQGNAAFGGFGASSATCTSGIDPFNANLVVTPDCVQAIESPLKTRSVLDQDIFEVNATGKALTLPAGDLKVAIGATHRQDRYNYENDTLTTQGSSFQDQAIGIYPSGNSHGEITVKEIYGEALVPILKDLPLVHNLEAELGIRESDYDTTGSNMTWKAMLNWSPTDYLRFRGGYNRAVRAPNIAELFLAPQQTFVFNASGDLCSLANTSPYSANPANANGSKVLALCQALMNAAAPGTAARFYSTNGYYNSTGGTFAFPTLAGNPDAKPELAHTWTFGAVFTSPWDNQYLHSLRATVDFYHINVNDALGPQSIDVAQRQCFDTAFNPTLSITSPYCAGINRVANDGALGNIITTYYNNGRFQTEGVDTQVDWSFDAGPGRVLVNILLSNLLSLKSAELKTDPLVEYAGTLGPSQNGLDPGAFSWKMFNTVGYSWGPVTTQLQWEHLPSIKAAEYPADPTTPFSGASSYDMFNLSATYSFSKDITVRAGIDNLLDKAPPITEVTSAPAAGTLPGGAINDVLYDVEGRRFYVGATMKF